MAENAPPRGRAAVKFLFWTCLAGGLIFYLVHNHANGRLAAWYYHSAATDGYAVNADSFKNASRERPALLSVASVDSLEGLVAVRVKKGDRLPRHANGVIGEKILKAGKRAVLDGDRLKILVPWEIQQAKGFKFRDTFKHKGVETYPWAAVFNVVMILSIGLALGFMAEGLTDLMGIKLEKIRHFEGH
jgi:hypothetical protein